MEKYFWAGNKNGVKFWVAFAIVIRNVTVMSITVSNNTDGCSQVIIYIYI